EAVATDQGDPNDPSAVDSGVGKDKFQFQYAVVNPDGTLGAWQDLAQDGSGETFDDGSRFGPKFANKHGSTGSAGLPSGPDKVYAVRAAAEDGAGNVTDWAAAPVRYVRAGEAGVTEITIIDQSGSMDGTPLRSAIASASAEIGTRNDFDRVGVVSFSSGASVLFPLTTITPGSDVRERAQQTIAGLTATGGTSIGSGLLAAVGMLDSNVSGQTSFVVLTDGQENESPFIADVEGQIPGYVTVHGIALGSGADASAVQQLARSRGGQFFAAADPGDLPAVYARVSGAETGEQDVARRVGSIAPGGRQVMPFSVDDTAGGLTVGVTWPGSDMDLAVIAPDGTVYTHANPGAGRFTVGATAEFFRLPDAAPGTWQAVVNAVDVNPDGEPFEAFARVATPLTAEILTPTQTLNAGDTLPIRVRVSNGPPVLGATASAALIPPDPTSAPPLNVPLFDDGTHGDETANDGVYSNEAVVGAVGGGVYTLQVAVNGPGFVRAPSQQLLVTGGAPANDAPSVSAVGDQVSVGGAAVSVAVAIGDTETPADSLLVTVTSSNQSLLPDSGIVVSGTGAGRLLTLTPVPGQAGSATVTVSVTDTGGRTTSMRFALTAVPTPVAPAPVTPTGLLALGAPAGQIPFVGAFNPDGSLRFVFLAYDPSFLGGVNVTTGDVTGDGVADVVTAPARDTLPLVRVFDGQTGGLVREFFAPGAGLGGVYVAAGDLDGDGFAEIVAGAGTGALVEVFDGRTGAEETPFFAYAPGSVGGVPVFVTDLDGDGSAEIVTVARTGLRSDVRVFRAGGSLVAIFLV
ncbi:MAG: VWA domain-containing protein, partial [Planctomycetes bacterium]|nr:VWA domain-containing protein [Planctomycetota bacterium]